jgi:hypothetical protein
MKKCALLKKTQNSLNANIFVHIGFKNRTKKFNSIFYYKKPFFDFFQQHGLKEVVKGKNG